MLHLSTIKPDVLALLKEIFRIPFIKSNFGLAGGTSLALQIGHRNSIDLDIFSPEKFPPADLENLLAGKFPQKYEPKGKMQTMLFCNISGIKCDFVNEPFPLVSPFIRENEITFYSIPDICAMKMHTVCGRGKKKDFFDIYALLKLYGWNKMLEWFEHRYSKSQLFFLWKSITYFEDAENDPEINGIPPYTATWGEIKKYITLQCR
ncbi:MAG: nucleotidyl transferase AbiEii/AbiGii toxin family protein [Chitinophagaceae bacterium]|nr:nucleotidyl transferase AbiEii/AbiGii toxin family protein [Chitinophagaceae bacterium]